MTEVDRSHEERRAFRAGRVRLAFLTSAGSKVLGLIVQFLAVPLAVRSLGPERFGIYTMLVSALVWIDLGRLGVGPGLTRELSLAWNRGDRRLEQTLFSNAMFFLLTISALLGCALAAGFQLSTSRVDLVFGSSAIFFRSEILSGILIVGTFLVAQIVFSAGEAARSAYQEEYINNLTNSLANLASLAMIFAVAFLYPTIPAFSLAVFGAIALGKGANLAILVLKSRPYLLPRWRYTDKTQLAPLLGSSLAFWLIQIATLMMHNLSLVQLGGMIGARELTPFAVVFRLLQLLSTAVLMISMPLWPAITDAVVRGDLEWIRRAYRRLIFWAMSFCVTIACAVTFFGSTVIPYWVGTEVKPTMALNATLGTYFIIWMWNHCHSTVLFGLGRLWTVAAVTLCEGGLVLALSAVLVPHYGSLGTAMALCIAGMASTAWFLPMTLWRQLAMPTKISQSEILAPSFGTSTHHEEPIA